MVAVSLKTKDGGTTLTAIVEGIVCPHYEIDRETAQRDALEFVSALEAHGLMRTSEAAVVAGSGAEYDAAVL